MSKELNISDIPHYFTKTFQGSFLLYEIKRKESKELGKPFFSLCLQDATGTINGTIWQENMEDCHESLSGKVVDIKSLVTKDTCGQFHLIIRDMTERQDFQIMDYICGLTKEEECKYLNLLWEYINSIEDQSLKQLAQNIFQHIESLEKYPATCNGHHHFAGGFLVYTISVASMVNFMQCSLNQYNKSPLKLAYNRDLLIASALLHAIGTVRMLTPAPDIKQVSFTVPLTLYEITVQYIQETALKMEVKDDVLCLLFHIIGYLYNSKKRNPMIMEALILKNAVKLHDKISLLEHFMMKNQEAGMICDNTLRNYIYLKSEELT